ncbi:PepSY domain-containing protein [Psychrobacter lutiphocae]|uniref:PepSY domain-containing protein n=1 Tax=Psychrobacter lutiphocae TaxID=540500 RepID=UPI00037913E2|nr:PepSY domain-containing protein [Psychrobacter lutiphocae]
MKALSILATSTLLTIGSIAPSMAAPIQTTAAYTQINMDQAINIAKQSAQGKLKSVEFDRSDAEYEVEFASTTTKYEIKINAQTGAINSTKQKRIKTEDVAKYQALNNTKLDLTQAIAIAARNVQGQVTDAEFDIENGRSVYEVKVIQNGEKYKLEIDANTGAVLKSKRD